jgi:hypothetical protein
MLPQEDIYYRLLKDYDDKDIRLQLVSVERLWYYLNRVKDITSGGGSGTVTSVGLSMPSAFSVANSPVTTAGTLTVTGAGTTAQYIRGDGTLATFPTNMGGGGSTINYYLNGSINQGVFGGNTYYQMRRVPVIGINADFNINANGYIAQFITDPLDPNQLGIPAGNWNFEMYFSASSPGGSPNFYVELYKYNGVTFSLIASSFGSPEVITNGTAIDLYTTALAVPQTTLAATDRLAVRVFVNHSGRTITLHTQDSHLCEIITTLYTGVEILDEGTSLTKAVTSINFTGAGVTATNTGDAVTVTIPATPTQLYYIDSYAAITALAGVSGLVPGAFYQINDVYLTGDKWEVVLYAETTTTLSRTAEILYTTLGNTYKYSGQYDISVSNLNFPNGLITRVVDTYYNNIVEAESAIAMDNIVSVFQWNNSGWKNNEITGNSFIFFIQTPNTFINNKITGNSLLSVNNSTLSTLIIEDNTVHASSIELVDITATSNTVRINNNYVINSTKENVGGFRPGINVYVAGTTGFDFNLNNNHCENSAAYIENCPGLTSFSYNYLFNADGYIAGSNSYGIYLDSISTFFDEFKVDYNTVQDKSHILIQNSYIFSSFSGNKVYGYSNLNNIIGGIYASKIEITDGSAINYFDENKLTNGSFISLLSNDVQYFSGNELINTKLIGLIGFNNFLNNYILFDEVVVSPLNVLDFANLFIGNGFTGNRFINTRLLNTGENGSSITDFTLNEISNTNLDLSNANITDISYNIVDKSSFVFNDITYTKDLLLFNNNKIQFTTFNIIQVQFNSNAGQGITNNDFSNCILTMDETIGPDPDQLEDFSHNIITESELTFYFDGKGPGDTYNYNKIHRTKFEILVIGETKPQKSRLNNCTMINTNDSVLYGMSGVYTDRVCIAGTRSTFEAELDFSSGDVYNGTDTLTFINDWGAFVGVYTTINTGNPDLVNTFVNAPTAHPFYIFGESSTNLIYYQRGGNLVLDRASVIIGASEYSFAEFNKFKIPQYNSPKELWAMINNQKDLNI